MIAKMIKGKDFYGVLAYNDKKVDQAKGHVIDSNIGVASTIQKTRMFNLVRQLRPNLGKAVLHVSLNLPYEDNLSNEKFAQLGNDYLKGMGFDDNQFIIYMHTDQEHQHIHIIANRVKFSGEVVNDSKDLYRSKNLVRQLEEKYGLMKLDGNKAIKKSQITQKELEKAIRTGKAPTRFILQEEVKRAMTFSEGTKDFIQNLKDKNINPKFNISKSTGRVSGISFEHAGIIYKGSTLGKGYTWNVIIKNIDYEQDRDRSAILQTNSAKQGANRKTQLIGTGSEKSVGQPKDYLEATQKGFWNLEPYNSFKNELDDSLQKKRKRKGPKR